MKVILLIYGISWVILLSVYLISVYQAHHGKSPISNNEWYYIVLLLLFAPLVVLVIPFILISDHKKDKQNKKLQQEREKSERALETQKNAAIESYKRSVLVDDETMMTDCISVAHNVKKMIDDKKYDQIFDLFDSVSLPKGAKFGIVEANWYTEVSKPYVSPMASVDRFINDALFDFLIVENTPKGAWQAYLIDKLWYSLPLFGHSNYERRIYIDSPLEYNTIKPIVEEEKELIQQILKKQKPIHTMIYQNGTNYYIDRRFWNDWKGLVREVVEITIVNNRAKIFDVESATEAKYRCGLFF